MKPRLYLCNGWWVCETEKRSALDRTPLRAYIRWCFTADRPTYPTWGAA